MKLPMQGKILRAVFVGALLALPFIVTTMTLSASAGERGSRVATFVKTLLAPQPAEAIMMQPCVQDPDTGGCDSGGGGGCAGTVNQCTSNAECGSGERCALNAGDCGENVCQCIPQCSGKTCGPDGCGGFCGSKGGACDNAFTCSAGNCVPMPAYCPRTDNPITDNSITFLPSKDGSGNRNVKITSAYSVCPIGSVSPIPCNTYDNNQATCASEGCSYAPAVAGRCTPGADQVDCSQFDTATDCRNSPLAKNQCSWQAEPGGGGPMSPAAVGLAIAPGGGGTTYFCGTKPTFCSSTIQGSCLSDPGCEWIPPKPASCYGTPAFKTSTVVNIGQYSSKIYERKIYAVPVWNYESCSFWRCTTKTGYTPHYLEGSCVVGQRCGWADGCVVLQCVMSTSAQVTANYGSSPAGWTLTSGLVGGSYDPALLNNCWGSNPNGQFIPAPTCCTLGVDCATDGACGGTNNTCGAGTLNDIADSASQYLWNCNGTNGGANASCSQNKPPVNGICDNSVINGCTVGTLNDIADSSTYSLWNCDGSNGGTTASCGMRKPITGKCAVAHYACSAGVSSGGYDAGDRWKWDCMGEYGGANDIGCSEMKAEAGVCSSVHYGCVTPTASPLATQSDNLTNWKWTCPGRFGGSDTACQENKIPVVGKCATTHYSCISGSSVNNWSDGGYHYAWNCNGANGGANDSCTQDTTPPPVDGLCDYAPGHTYQCVKGTSIGGYDAGDAWKWNCTGMFGGNTDVCTVFKPVNGVCSSSHYSCDKGTSAANLENASKWTWTCNGLYGGLPQNCAENKDAVITWSPAVAPTIDYLSKVSYSYSTANAVSCDYYEVTPGGQLNWISGALNSSWVGPQGPYDTDVVRRLKCRNVDGREVSSDYRITVRQNNAKCVSVTAPDFLEPKEAFTATAKMLNTGDNGWTTGSANYVLSRNDSFWNSDTMHLTNPTVGKNVEGRFSESLKAPDQVGDFDFVWQMRPIINGSWWPVFGEPCGYQNGTTNKIHVQPATLALTPESYQFPDVVLGDDPSKVTIRLKNLGGGTINGIKLNPPAADNPPFSCISNCNLQLGPGKQGDVVLQFAPMATGSRSTDVPIVNSSSVPIVDEVTKLAVSSIYVYGKGTDKFVVSTDDAGLNMISNINFGDVPWTTTKYINLTIHNRSKDKSGDINPSIDLPSAFTCVTGCGARTLGPGATQSVRLKFYPDQKVDHVYSGTFNIGATPDVHLSISGHGVLPEFQTQER